MATVRTDASRADFIVAATLPATGAVALGNDTKADNGIGAGGNGSLNTRPFSAQALLGFNHASLTVEVPVGSTAVGSLQFQVTDFGGDNSNEGTAYAIPDGRWVTVATQSVTSGANALNQQLPNIASKWLRVRYVATSGTGTINVAITCRANGR